MAAATDRISAHEVKLLLVFQRQPDRWLANGEVAEAAGISPRTARLHTSRLVDLGVLEVERVHPASKFRLAPEPGKVGKAYLERWGRAREVLGL
jgi:DNA-binding IclR family transcriptional regulator